MKWLRRLAVDTALASIAGDSRPVVKMLRKVGVRGCSFATDYGLVTVPLNSRSIIQSFFQQRYFEEAKLRHFLNFPSSATRLLNVGANVGTSARMIASRGRYQRIDCFEPDPDNFEFLRMNMAGLDGTTLHNVAAGSRDDRLNLHLNPNSVGRHSFKTDFGRGSITVPVVRLDGLIGDGERFDLFVDVEGWEIEVLRGAAARLGACELCAFEFNGQLHGVEDRRAAAELLQTAGFVEALDLDDPTTAMPIADLVGIETQRDIVAVRDHLR